MHRYLNISGVMGLTLLALIPALITQILFWGWGPLLNLSAAALTAMAAEALCLRLRRRPIAHTLADGSALLSGAILALCLPPQLPLSLVIFAAAFMMVFGKHIFGGLGANPFNPAMLAYIMLLLSFPLDMTEWLRPNLGGYLAEPALLLDKLPFFTGRELADGYSAATALDSLRSHGNFAQWAAGWERANFIPYLVLSMVYAGGGLFILAKRIISWHIPLSFLAGLLLPAALFSWFSPNYAPAWFHLIMGGTVFGAFFVATDPVSAATNRRSRLVYGFGIGLFVYIIRTWGGYADAVAFGVLFFNFVAPFIDKYVRPRIYGH